MEHQYYSSGGSAYAGAHPTHAGTMGGAGSRYAAHASQKPQDPYYQDPTHIMADYYSNDGHSNWETKSYQSDYSQAHLNPQHEMRSVNVHNAPPVPPLPYQAYPPAQQPFSDYASRPAYRASPGYSSVREKLMRRRVSANHASLLK
jgi:chitin synthase